MYLLVGKVDILVATTVGTYFMSDSFLAPTGGDCPFRDPMRLCV